MSFLPPSNNAQNTERSSRSRFVKIVTGIPVTVQILDEVATVRWQHWIKDSEERRVSVRCLGYKDCPICLNNRSVGKESPQYVRSQRRYLVNVLNLTFGKRSPFTDEVFIATKNSADQIIYPDMDSEANSLTDVAIEPVREVMILERGPQLFEKFDLIDKSVVDSNGEEVGITNYPIQLNAKGSGRSMTIDVAQQAGSPLTVNSADYEDSKFDLNAGFTFTADEISAMLDGVASSDIYSARKAEEETQVEVPA